MSFIMTKARLPTFYPSMALAMSHGGSYHSYWCADHFSKVRKGSYMCLKHSNTGRDSIASNFQLTKWYCENWEKTGYNHGSHEFQAFSQA